MNLKETEIHTLILELMKRKGYLWKLSRGNPYPPLNFIFSIALSDQDIEKLQKEQDFKDIMQNCFDRSKQINKEIIESGDLARIDRILKRNELW